MGETYKQREAEVREAIQTVLEIANETWLIPIMVGETTTKKEAKKKVKEEKRTKQKTKGNKKTMKKKREEGEANKKKQEQW